MNKITLNPANKITLDSIDQEHHFSYHGVKRNLSNDIWFCSAAFPFVTLNLGGVGVFLYQCILWLRSGNWSEFHIYEFTQPYLSADFMAWLVAPESWIGLSRISSAVLHEAPLSGSLIFISFLWVFFLVWLLSVVERKRKVSQGSTLI